MRKTGMLARLITGLAAFALAGTSLEAKAESNDGTNSPQYRILKENIVDTQTQFIEGSETSWKFRKGYDNYPGETQSEKRSNCLKACIEGEEMLLQAAFEGRTSDEAISKVAKKYLAHLDANDDNVCYTNKAVFELTREEIGLKIKHYQRMREAKGTTYNEILNNVYTDCDSFVKYNNELSGKTQARNIAMKSTIHWTTFGQANGVFDHMANVEENIRVNEVTNAPWYAHCQELHKKNGNGKARNGKRK